MTDPLISIEKLTDSELVAGIENDLADLGGMMAEFRKPHRALHAQILIQERTARQQRMIAEEQRKQARLMVRCTAWMTVLTVVITIMTAVLLWKTFSPT